MRAVDRANNIAHYLEDNAKSTPCKKAVIVPVGRDKRDQVSYAHYTYEQLNSRCDGFAKGFKKTGMKCGDRVLLMVRPGLDFFALTFAIFKLGAVPIFIDPGMGRKKLFHCIAQSKPDAFIGIPIAHIMRLVFPRYFKSITQYYTLGKKLFWSGYSVDNMPSSKEEITTLAVSPDDIAAILFTTGSTGPAKGVVYSHEVFCTQTEILRREFKITPDDIDLPCFPLFALFTTALGATAVIPDMDPTRPAHVDSTKIIEAIRNQGVTYSFGSPTLWNRVGKYCQKNNIKLPSLNRVLMAGAPVPEYVHESLLNHVLPPNATTHVPYGATESLPVALFTGKEMLAKTAKLTRDGAGICVGYPIDEVTVKIINTDDNIIKNWSSELEIATGDIGEIVVRGAVVTKKYHFLEDATAKAKIQDGKYIWHRMGDLGYMDDNGRLWFCGRKAHRVINNKKSWYSVQCEAVFNEHPHVYRTALVGLGEDRYNQKPLIIVELVTEKNPKNNIEKNTIIKELQKIAMNFPHTKEINDFLFYKSFPVDIRHNAKIGREQLTTWAAQQKS